LATFPLHQRHQQHEQHSAHIQRQLERDIYNTQTPTTHTRASGDTHTLRGIPVVGVKGGLGGAIPGTKP
jgi:hypothetical protein